VRRCLCTFRLDKGTLVSVCLVLALAILVEAREATGGWFITPEEAALAPAPEETLIRSRGLNDKGPIIEVVRPEEDKPQSNPLEIVVKFLPRSASSAAVDVASLKVSLVKLFTIDITDRVREFVTTAGIELKEAKIPSGRHTVRINLSDTTGQTSTREITFEVR
jgi:hypothetical protein